MSNLPFEFKVGKKYVSRGGEVYLFQGEVKFPNFVLLHFAEMTGGYRMYTNLNGMYNTDMNSHLDIVGEYIEPTTTMFDPTKPFKTANGREVKLLTTNGEGPYPIVGYVKFADGIHWGNVTSWMANGISTCVGKFNLVNDPPVKKIVPLEYGDCNSHYIFKNMASRCYVGYLSPSCIQLMSYKKSVQHNLEFKDLLTDGWEYSKDGGETWQLCQKEVIK